MDDLRLPWKSNAVQNWCTLYQRKASEDNISDHSINKFNAIVVLDAVRFKNISDKLEFMLTYG